MHAYVCMYATSIFLVSFHDQTQNRTRNKSFPALRMDQVSSIQRSLGADIVSKHQLFLLDPFSGVLLLDHNDITAVSGRLVNYVLLLWLELIH